MGAGCSSKNKNEENEALLKQLAQKSQCEPPPIEFFFQPRQELNKNREGQSMPVEVRIYFLKDRVAFEQLDFETLWKEGERALEKDLLKSVSLTVIPGEHNIYPMKSEAAAQYIALVAIFRRPEARRWAYLVDVRDANSRCAGKNELHTLIPVALYKNWIGKPRE